MNKVAYLPGQKITGSIIKDGIKVVNDGSGDKQKFIACTLKVVEKYKDKNDEWKEEVVFWEVNAYGKTADIIQDNERYVLELDVKWFEDKWEDKETGKQRSRKKAVARFVQPYEWIAEPYTEGDREYKGYWKKVNTAEAAEGGLDI